MYSLSTISEEILLCFFQILSLISRISKWEYPKFNVKFEIDNVLGRMFVWEWIKPATNAPAIEKYFFILRMRARTHTNDPSLDVSLGDHFLTNYFRNFRKYKHIYVMISICLVFLHCIFIISFQNSFDLLQRHPTVNGWTPYFYSVPSYIQFEYAEKRHWLKMTKKFQHL